MNHGVILFVRLMVLAGFAFWNLSANATGATQFSCESRPQILPLPSSDAAVTLRVTSPGAWLQIEEAGQQVRVSSTPASKIISVSQPLRLGWHWVQAQTEAVVTVNRIEPNFAEGSIRIRIDCSLATERHMAWLSQLSMANTQVDHPVDHKQLQEVLQRLNDLEREAGSDFDRAMVVQLRALGLIAMNQSVNAKNEYANAERYWQKLNEFERAHAARVGQAYAANVAGEFISVVRDTQLIVDHHSAPAYFDTRLLGERCLALEEVGRYTQATHCYEFVLSRLKLLDERTEYLLALKNLASLQRKLGNFDAAERIAQQGIESARLWPTAAMARGRFHLLLSSIAQQRGNIASAVRHIDIANVEFSRAGATSLFFRGSSRLNEAALFEQIGAYSEAYAALSEAFEFLPGDNALALRAKIFADLEADTHHEESALFWSRVAEKAFALKGMTPAAEAVRLNRQWLLLRRHESTEVSEALEDNPHALPAYAPQWRLLKAANALEQARLPDAHAALAAVYGESLPLRDQLRYQRMHAGYLDNTGNRASAQHALFHAYSRLIELAHRTRSQILSEAIVRQGYPLRAMAMRLILSDAMEGMDRVMQAWKWISAETAERPQHGTASATQPIEQFDRAVADELLTTQPVAKSIAVGQAQRALLSIMAAPENQATAVSGANAISYASLQQRLAPDAAFLAYLDGESRGGILWITREDARVLDAAAPEVVRTSTLALRETLRTPATPLTEVQSSAQTLSTQLLGKLPAGSPPKHLYVLADEMMSRVAWTSLTWPGQSAALIETTTTEFARLTSNEDAHAASQHVHELHLVVASQDQADGMPLAHLATASVEPQMIRAALAAALKPSKSPVAILAEGEAGTRDALLSALDEPGAWVHVAAHGTAQPRRIGYAGIWLAPVSREPTSSAAASPSAVADSGSSGFLSWLDILERGVRADLVVLNACQLGDSGSAINGNLSFADAVSRAGAREVVAAMWPVSDAAAALWVPAFYAALAADPQHDAADALRAAQLRLRDSRAFTHPFFWAGMQVIARLDIAGERQQ